MGLFDQLSKTLSQGVDRAKFEAEKFQKTTRLQSELNELQRQINEKLMELGNRAYELQRAGQISAASISELSNILDRFRSDLVRKEEELKSAQAEQFIEPIGSTPPSGAPAQSVPVSYESTPPPAQPAAPPPMPAAQSATKACGSCGFVMPATAMFCPNCGNRVA